MEKKRSKDAEKDKIIPTEFGSDPIVGYPATECLMIEAWEALGVPMDCEEANENDGDTHAEKSELGLREMMKDDFSRVFPNWIKFCFKT